MDKKNVTRILAATFAGACCLALNGCQEQGPAERAGENIDDAAERTGEAVEDTGEAIRDGARGDGGGGY